MEVTPARGQYRQVADILRAAIAGGEHPRGSMLPAESELAGRFGVSRQTVNRAFAILEAEGLIRVERPTGTIVHELPPIVRNAAARHSRTHREREGSRGALATELANLDYELRSKNTVGPGHPPAHVAEVLGVAPDEASVVIRARYMRAEDVPIQIVTSYIPLVIAKDTPIEQKDPGVGGISSRLAELGHAQVEIEEHITVRPPVPEEATFLRMTEDQRVYEIFHIGWTHDDRPVKVTIYIMPTHQWDLQYRYPIEPSG
ncbi:GntR family transcriptional regulator [Streptosporangium lutulentum]|uniref:GntR family transcriptional regulator n=1 Tax=Streptosporangium lutulentum TaxID=1461250 RepID=A0ABT9QU06_9ACTN|nr:GntR family transcriptional regulator [Streptosporangium lutulentum]MDP9850237.1 GntR family transcriptional regulator [Streptosporangium lutulentum]